MDGETLADVEALREELRTEYPAVWGLSEGRHVNIEAETSTIEKPRQTLTNLRKAVNAGRFCVFTLKDESAEKDEFGYWGRRGEQVLYDSWREGNETVIDHDRLTFASSVDENGHRHFYNKASRLEFEDGVYALRPAYDDDTERSLTLEWVETDDGVVCRDSTGTVHARFDTVDDLETTIDEFLESGNKSGNYRQSLERVLTQWRERFEDRGIETVEQVGKRHMANYAKYLSQRVDAGKSREVDGGISPGAAWTYFDYVSAFCSYCVRWDYLEENPAQKGIALEELPPRPTKKSGDQQFWTPEDRKALLRYADERAYTAVDEKGTAALEELRDRALAYVFAYTGVRSGEILSDSRDDRRNGLRWDDVDLENSQLLVLGKNQQREEVQLPWQVYGPLERLEAALEPPSVEWPVFVTSHAPSLYRGLPDGVGSADGDPLKLHRKHGTVPASLSTNGGRSVLKRLCDEADIDVDGGYLKPHGARRGVGEVIYRERGAAAAQRVLRHADPRTTSQMYAHIEANELAEETSMVFENE